VFVFITEDYTASHSRRQPREMMKKMSIYSSVA